MRRRRYPTIVCNVLPLCPHCEIPIGAYEPFVWRMPDGSTIGSEKVPRNTDIAKALDDRGERLHRSCAEEADSTILQFRREL